MKSFKEIHEFEDRLKESQKIREKYPSRIPIIVEKCKNSQMKDICKNKYLAPSDMPMSQFIFTIRKRIELDASEAIFVMVNNTLVQSNTLLSELYETQGDKDGFLYMVYTSENTFG